MSGRAQLAPTKYAGFLIKIDHETQPRRERINALRRSKAKGFLTTENTEKRA